MIFIKALYTPKITMLERLLILADKLANILTDGYLKALDKISEEPIKDRNITDTQRNALYNDSIFVKEIEDWVGEDWKNLIDIGISKRKCCGTNRFAIKTYRKETSPKGIIKAISGTGYLTYCGVCGERGMDERRASALYGD